MSHDQILDLGQRSAAAESSGDAEALGALLADDFVLVPPGPSRGGA
jgi:hypothetical protein